MPIFGKGTEAARADRVADNNKPANILKVIDRGRGGPVGLRWFFGERRQLMA
jgi:hypothetical protein